MASESEEEGRQQYKPGSIRRVRLENFLTYEDVEFSPGPRLNVVMGPNGTGKSTILCAICLGLGGQPVLLGRADDARTFIMHEKEQALIEIELAPHSEERRELHVLRRIIDRNKGSERGRGLGASAFFINGQPSTIKAVQQLVTDTYHIAVDNLCTFLPQDRVGSFSGFTPQSLLEETEKSLSGNKHLYTDHVSLIQLEAELRSSGNTVESVAERLQALQAETEHLQQEKELMEQREQYMERLDLLEKKKIWLEFDQTRQHAIELKEQKAEAKNELASATTSLQPLEEAHAQAQSESLRATKLSKKLGANMTELNAAYQKAKRKAETFQDEMEGDMGNLSSVESMQRRAERQAAQQKEKVEQMESQLQEFAPQEDLQRERDEAVSDLRQVKSLMEKSRRDLGRLTNEMTDLKEQLEKRQSRLAKMSDERARRKERIFRQNSALAETYHWVEQNRKMFRRPVWGPIVCEVLPENAKAADYLEQHVANAIFKAYVVENREDYDLLFREVREKLRKPINIQIVPGGRLEPITRMYSPEMMDLFKKHHGIVGYLDETFEAPDPVLQALRSSSAVHSVLVGTDKTHESIDDLRTLLSKKPDDQPGLQGSCVFCSNRDRSYKYTTVVSRYSGRLNTKVDEVTTARMLAAGVDQQQKENLEREVRELEEQMKTSEPVAQETRAKYEELVGKATTISQRKADSERSLNDLHKIQGRIQSARRRLKDLEESASKDNAAEKAEIVARLKRHVSNFISALEAATNANAERMTQTCSLAAVKMTEEGLASRERRLHDELADKRQESAALKEKLDKLSDRFNRVKAEMRKIKEAADEKAPLKDADGNDLPLKALLEELPATLEELEDAMEEARGKVDSIRDNPEVLRRYEARQKEMEEMRRELEGLHEAKDAKRTHIDTIRRPWEAALQNTVQKTNVLFGKYMAELGYAGEVRLARGNTGGPREGAEGDDDTGSFKDWGIEIRVKFREGSDLQRLSAQVQSGGERSVSTIMYLMALQELMVCPFRCVDEINQGLDERNERFVFKRIVENSTKLPQTRGGVHSGQYFLITPKLLPNLTDMENENVTILCIFNGPHNLHWKHWNFSRFLSYAPGRSAEEDDD